MIMQPREYPGVGDTLWSGRLPNGLAIRVVPRPGFQKNQAARGLHGRELRRGHAQLHA